MIFRCQIAASLLLLPALSWAQQPEIGTTETAVTFSTSTTLVPVKVVVRDRQGRTVGNLQGSDFLVLDRGKQQVISRYSLEKTEALQVQVEADQVDDQGKPVLQPRRTGPW